MSHFLKDYIYLFLEKGEGREKERERNIDMWEIHWLVASHTAQMGTWPATQACTLTGNRTSNLSVCRQPLSPLSHTSQGEPLKIQILRPHTEPTEWDLLKMGPRTLLKEIRKKFSGDSDDRQHLGIYDNSQGLASWSNLACCLFL